MMDTSQIFLEKSISCEHWLGVLDELGVGAFTVDVERKVTDMNLTAQGLIGLRVSETIGKDCREVFVGIPCLTKCPFRGTAAADSDEPVVQIKDEDENVHFITRMATTVYGPDRRVVGCLTILQDHSPIADLIDRIQYEERSLRIILDNLDIGIFTVDRGGHITFFNREAEKISMFNRREVLGKPFTAVFKESKGPDVGLLQQSLDDGHMRSSRQGTITTRYGVTIPIRANYIPLRNEKGAVVGGLATFHDLTLVQYLNQAMQDRFSFHDMIGKDPAMQRVFEMVEVVAATDATILIEGATGTGKDFLAAIIHFTSNRSEKPFVKVNCAAIPEALLESEMFGYERGAFTGATRDKIGRFQEADGGTIFLDEIGDLPLALQAKLLRVLEDREFYPLGSRHTVKVDVRILSATNRRLEELVEKRLFREDLYYRLNVFRIQLPLLKDRRGDLPILIADIVRRLCATRGLHLREISEEAMAVLLSYDYPGNVRELENILEHALIICREDALLPQHLP
jgi:PAS domain S-box-containing protein